MTEGEFLMEVGDSDVLSRKEEILDAIYLNAEDEESSLSSERLEIIEEDLTECAANRINLNNESDLDRLELLPFLSLQQVENIRTYVSRHGPIQSYYELTLVDGLFRQDVLNLLPFVTLGTGNEEKRKEGFGEMLRGAGHELLLRTDRTIETKKGYRSDTPRGYLGNAQYASIRYRLRYKNRLYLNLSGEKDAGEPFWNNTHKGFDAYRYSIQYNNGINRYVMGHYKASFGLGLLLNSDFFLSKDPSNNRIVGQGTGLRRYSTAEGSDYLHGVGVTQRLSTRWCVTGLYSNRLEDAVLRDEGRTFASLTTDGLHRTETERNKMDNVRQQVAAGRVEWHGDRLRIGGTFLWQHYDPYWKPLAQAYNKHRFEGRNLSITSLDYRMHWRRITIMGETAIDDQGAAATVNHLSVVLHRRVRLSALYRNYSKRYDNPMASTYAQSSNIRNEEGFYVGLSVQPWKHWQLSGYADVFRFPELKYGVSEPSDGREVMMRLDHTPTSRLKWSVRYRMRTIEKDLAKSRMPAGTEGKILTDYDRSALRGRVNWAVNAHRTMIVTAQAEGSRYDYSRDSEESNYGWMANGMFTWRPRRIPLRSTVGISRFDAEDYENRFYLYENDVLYGCSIPMLYGAGWRCSLTTSGDLGKHITLYLFIARTTYDDGRKVISSGLEEIKGRHKTDLHFLIRWRF